MRHEYLDTLLKIKKAEVSFGADLYKIPDINLKIRNKLLKEDGSDFDFSPGYIAKTRNTIRHLRRIRKDGMSGLEYIEKNRQNLIGMQERGINNLIDGYKLMEKTKRELKSELQKLELSIKDCRYCIKTPKKEYFETKDGNVAFCNACIDIGCSDAYYQAFVLDRNKLKEYPSIKSMIRALCQYDLGFTLENIN